MAYTSFEKFTTVAFAVGKTVATGTTCFAAGTAMSLSSPLITLAVVVGAGGSLAHTVYSKLNQIKKARDKLSRIEELESDQKLLMELLAALKPQMQNILDKEREKMAVMQPKRNPASPVSLNMSSDEQAKKVAQVRREFAAEHRSKARVWREKRVEELDDALQKLNLAIKSPNEKLVENKPITETPEEVQASQLENVAKIGTGFFNGLGQAGAVTFAAISTLSQALSQEVALLSPTMIVPVVVVGVGVGIGNAIRSNKEYANELQEEKLYQEYRARKKELQAEYKAINSLLEQLNEPEQEPVKKARGATTALPGSLTIPSPNTPVRRATSGEKSGDDDLSASPTSEKSGEALSPKAAGYQFPAAGQTDIALTIRPATPASGAPKIPAQQTDRATHSAVVRPDVTGGGIRPTTASSVSIEIRESIPTPPTPVSSRDNKLAIVSPGVSQVRSASASLGAKPTIPTKATPKRDHLSVLSTGKSSGTRQARPAAISMFAPQTRAKTPGTNRKPRNISRATTSSAASPTS